MSCLENDKTLLLYCAHLLHFFLLTGLQYMPNVESDQGLVHFALASRNSYQVYMDRFDNFMERKFLFFLLKVLCLFKYIFLTYEFLVLFSIQSLEHCI